jgi:hypothetical protein
MAYSKESTVKLKKTAMVLPALAILIMGALLSACGDQAGASTGSTGSTGQSAAKSQFLADRGGGTPGVNSSGTPEAGGGNRAPGLAATVEKVDGNKITVKSMADGTEGVVQLGDGAKINKTETAQASDIKTGDTVTAIGTKNGDTITAETVSIGTGGFGGARGNFGGRGAGANGTPVAGGNGDANGVVPSGTPGAGFGGNGGNRNRAFPSGTPGAGFGGNGQGRGNFGGGANAQGTPGVPRDVASGTVQKIDGATVTIQAADGTTSTFTIASDARIQKSVEIQPADLKAGDTIFATGQLNGAVFEATAIQVTENFGQQTPAATTP